MTAETFQPKGCDNLTWTAGLLNDLFARGVSQFVVCPGARNAPLVIALERASSLGASHPRTPQVYQHFEDRAAAFFALGWARRTQRPVAVVVTSGTAVAELLPAVVEADYAGVPLVLITADRPQRLRGSGAPQVIVQPGIFREFIDREFDIEAGSEWSLPALSRTRPTHLNVCYDEPLIANSSIDLCDSLLERDLDAPLQVSETEFERSDASLIARESIEWLKRYPRSIALIGGMDPGSGTTTQIWADVLGRLRIPVFAEGPSGLREFVGTDDRVLRLRSGEALASELVRSGEVDAVLRIGGVPTTRAWREIDLRLSNPHARPLHVRSFSPLRFAGLAQAEHFAVDLNELGLAFSSSLSLNPRALSVDDLHWQKSLKERDSTRVQTLEELLDRHTRSEPAFIRRLSRALSPQAMMYIGNSLPIREWDLVADPKCAMRVHANRGVNGIDGQISTFLGEAPVDRPSVALIGDLTALYDLAAPWILEQRASEFAPGCSPRIFIMNNGGGLIFRRIFKNPAFENSHSRRFSSFASLWNLDYATWEGANDSPPQTAVVEIRPDPEETRLFWSEWDRACGITSP